MPVFTEPAPDTDWQSIDFLNEMISAFLERISACGASYFPYGSLVTVGADLQHVVASKFWNAFSITTLQLGMEDAVGRWYDHTATPAIGLPAKFTLASWRTAAGMHVSGYRRATEWVPGAVDGTWENDVTFSYGTFQAGDIIGPWLWEDIQRGLDAMRWCGRTTVRGGSGVWNNWSGIAYRGGSRIDVCSTALSDLSDEWDLGYNSNEPTPTYFLIAERLATDWRASALRGSSIVDSLPLISRTYDLYHEIYNNGFSPSELSVMGLGWLDPTTTGSYFWQQQITDGVGGSAATITAPLLSVNDTFPIDAVGWTCPYGTTLLQDLHINNTTWILKWSFTYTL